MLSVFCWSFMTKFKNYLVKKNIDSLTALSFDRNAYFTYRESSMLDELIIGMTGRIKKNTIRNVLVDLSISFESLLYEKDNDSNHEDLIEVGYLLGLLHATNKGCVYATEFADIRYYFVGVESDIVSDVRDAIRNSSSH